MILNWLTAILLLATSVSLLLNRDWRWSLGLLAIQYIGAFWLVQTSWPIMAATAKLVTGWMACAALGMTLLNTPPDSQAEKTWMEGRLFRWFTAGLTAVIAFALAARGSEWLGIQLPVVWGGLLLITTGLVHVSITTQPLRVIIGLLTVLSGFEIIYAAVESSALVAAALAVVTLGLALAGAYMLVNPASEETK